MKVTCGTDIIEIDRIKDIIDKEKEQFLNRVYTKNEIEYCEGKKSVKYQHYAARFAAKEAIFKAVSSALKDKFELSWKDAEILNEVNGKPEVRFIQKRPQNLENIDISISHCKTYAVANAVATWFEK